MHEYRNSEIAKVMKTIKQDVSDVDQHIAHLVAKALPEDGRMGRLLFLGALDSLVPCMLGMPRMSYVVYSLIFHISYVELQKHYTRMVRNRYGRCFNRPLAAAYKELDLRTLGGLTFPYIVVDLGAEFAKVKDFCKQWLVAPGVLVVVQRLPCEIEMEGMDEIERTYLKTTEAGYCIECDEEKAEYVVVVMKKGVEKCS